jgi:hypothetical protein
VKRLKEKIENNVAFILVGVAIASGTVVFSVTAFFHNSKIEAIEMSNKSEIQDLRSKIISIERNIGTGQYFDIRNLIYNGSLTPRAWTSYLRENFILIL